jgi:hypothetical protein
LRTGFSTSFLVRIRRASHRKQAVKSIKIDADILDQEQATGKREIEGGSHLPHAAADWRSIVSADLDVDDQRGSNRNQTDPEFSSPKRSTRSPSLGKSGKNQEKAPAHAVAGTIPDDLPFNRWYSSPAKEKQTATNSLPKRQLETPLDPKEKAWAAPKSAFAYPLITTAGFCLKR